MDYWDVLALTKERYPNESHYYHVKYTGMYKKCMRWRKKYPDTWLSFVLMMNENTRSPGEKQAIADFLYNPLE